MRATNSRASSGSRSTVASAENSLPTTAARLITARSPGPRRSRRADNSAAIVGGIASSASWPTSFCEHGDELLDEQRVPLGGLEHSAFVAGARPRARLRDQRLAVRVRKALEQEGARVRASRGPSQAAPRAARAGRCRRGGSGTPRTRSARYSTRSRKVGSAQWTSSKKRTRGRSRASASNRLRVAQKISSRSPTSATPIASEAVGERRASVPSARIAARPPAGELADHLAQRPEGDPLAVGNAAADENGACSAASAASSCASLDFPIPAVPRIVSRCSVRSPGAARTPAGAGRARALRPTSGAFNDPTAGRSRARSRSRQAGPALGLDRLDRRASANEPLGVLAEEDLPGGGGVLELGRRGHGVADDRHRAGPANRWPGPRRSRSRRGRRESISSRAGRVADLERRGTARNASSSWTRGTPNTAITALPRLLAIVPP